MHKKRQIVKGLLTISSLSVSLRSVMGLAEHLAVLDIRRTALGPRSNVVRVHILQIPDTRVIGIVSHSTQRTVGLTLQFRRSGLRGVHPLKDRSQHLGFPHSVAVINRLGL